MSNRISVCAIVPAHNEEVTVGHVVQVLLASPVLTEVMVVSDGSSDQTVSVARGAGARVIETVKKGGKGQAMLFGLAHTQADIVMFFDADLIGLTPQHVEQLVRPVLDGKLVMNVSLRDRGKIVTRLTQHLPLISGERAVRRDILKKIPPRFMNGYMIEIALNYYCRSRGIAYATVISTGLSFRKKYQKVGFGKSVLQYIRMSSQIAWAMVIIRIAHMRGKF